MKHYWRIDRVRNINKQNIIEHINFLYKYNGTSYSALQNYANAFYNQGAGTGYFGSIVTQYNMLGLYSSNSDGTYNLSDLGILLYNNNDLVNSFLEFYLLKFQFPRPHLDYIEDVTIPYLVVLKILLKLQHKDPNYSYFTKREFYNLFNENAIRIKLDDIDDKFIDDLINNNRNWGLSQPAISGTDDLTYDKNFFCNSQFINSEGAKYNNPIDFYVGLSKDIGKIHFAQFILHQYSNSYFNYDQTQHNPPEKRLIKNQWSHYSNNKEDFFKYLNQKNMLQNKDDFRDFCSDKGYYFDENLIRRFLTSLSAKPFLLLTGISGTGKSKIAELYGEFITSVNLGRFIIKAVGSNWNDNKNLLGYFNPLVDTVGRYFPTELVEFISDANANRDKTFILLLDEMNLSYTERYFSDFLSALESLTNEITLPDGTKILWSENLKIIGTINEDETTHTLSPKVIDRANIIEMNGALPSIYLNDLIAKGDDKIINLINKDWHLEYIVLFDSIYTAFNGKFGYRTIDEITKYIIINVDYTGKDYKIYLDEQIYQKLLPKLYGTRGEILDKLEQLHFLFNPDNDDLSNSFTKLSAMINQIKKTGFTSFTTV
jgi:hypothetical protein